LKPETTDKDLVTLCQQYGKIISTKAIIDQTTNQCKGYGFVDFESAQSAEIAVKALQASGVQAQMAKQQEQDTTNLYIANLPSYLSEAELKLLFAPYGQVISTRVLRDNQGHSRGVGFARMESKEKCDLVIHAFNGKCLPGHKEPLMVKFADGGSKKKLQYHNLPWFPGREHEGLGMNSFEHIAIAHNGLVPAVMTHPAGMPRYAVATTPLAGYHMSAGASGWLHYAPAPYIMPGPLTAVMPTGLPPTGVDPNSVQHLASQMSQLQLSTPSFVSSPPGGATYVHLSYPPPSILPPYQPLAMQDRNLATSNDDSSHHMQVYISQSAAN
jgi:hypothetical protein